MIAVVVVTNVTGFKAIVLPAVRVNIAIRLTVGK